MTTASVFVSRPAVMTSEQQTAYARGVGRLADLGFAVLTVARSSYADSPWAQLRESVRSANGAVILGFQQLAVERGCRRPGTPEEAPAHRSYASAWNQIEAGLAAMAELPVLVVPEGDASEGVFSRDVWRDSFYGTHIDIWTSGAGDEDPAIRGWAAAVRRHADSHPMRQR